MALLLAVGCAPDQPGSATTPAFTDGRYWPFEATFTEEITEGSRLLVRETYLFAGAAWDDYVRVLLRNEDADGPIGRSAWGDTLMVRGRDLTHAIRRWPSRLVDGEQSGLGEGTLQAVADGLWAESLSVTTDTLPADADRQAPAALFTDFWTQEEAADQERLPAAEATGESTDVARMTAHRLGLPMDDLRVILLPQRPDLQGFLVVLDASPEVPVAALIDHPAYGFTERLEVERLQPLPAEALESVRGRLEAIDVRN